MDIEKELKEKTDQLTEERFRWLDALTKYQAAKEAVQLREAEITQELAAEVNGQGKPKFSNAETREAERIIRQQKDEIHRVFVSERNDNWHAVKVAEIVVERVQQSIANLRVVMSL